MSKSASQMFKQLRSPNMRPSRLRQLCEEKGVTREMAYDIYGYTSVKKKILQDWGRDRLYDRDGRIEYIVEATDKKIGEVFRKDYDSAYESVGHEKGQLAPSASSDVGKLVSQEEARRLFEELREAVK